MFEKEFFYIFEIIYEFINRYFLPLDLVYYLFEELIYLYKNLFYLILSFIKVSYYFLIIIYYFEILSFSFGFNLSFYKSF